MEKLVHLTGGVFILDFISIILAILTLIITTINFLIRMKKVDITKQQKTFFIAIIITLIFDCLFIGYYCGYYIAMYAAH